MDNCVNIAALAERVQAITERAIDLEARYSADIEAVHPEYRDSARNLVHYLALRQLDISGLQRDLASLGLSSLGQTERNVLGSLVAVYSTLQKLCGESEPPAPPDIVRYLENPAAGAHKRAILGEHPDGRDVSIMVTLPTEAAENPLLASEMIAAGMNIARINCAHDNTTTWAAMIENVRAASPSQEHDCRIIMDLAGPKLRTGDLLPGPRVLRISPKRDQMGRVLVPRRVRFMPDDIQQRGTKSAVVPVSRECVEYAEEGDEIRFKDTRGKKRRLRVVQKDDKGFIAEAYKSTYFATGTKLRLLRNMTGETLTYRVGELPAVEEPLLLRTGDTLLLENSDSPGAPERRDADDAIVQPAHIPCQQPEVFEFVKVGDPVSLNDGKISGVIRSTDREQIEIEITKAKPAGNNLRGNRGINFPGSDIQLPGLTPSDKANLAFVVENADAVALSFIRRPDDIVLLQQELAKHPGRNPGLVLKIETKKGFRNLPELLLTAMRNYPVAVMIARGDLAVECGWERLAELQEEILWFCEAAQVPVMWATQVLEQTAKKGQPSRAEISDAAMSQRADCVMLNKGPHILAAIRMLDNILRRMQRHQFKKTARMQKLNFPATHAQ